MVWRASFRSLDIHVNTRTRREKEELDRAIALSLADDFERSIGHGWRSDTDFDTDNSSHDHFNPGPFPSGHRRRINTDDSIANSNHEHFNPLSYPLGNRRRTNTHDDIGNSNSSPDHFIPSLFPSGHRWRKNTDEGIESPNNNHLNPSPFPTGQRWRRNTDEHMESPNNDYFNPAPLPSYAPQESYPRGYRICAGCKREIGHSRYLGCMGEFFHPECFRCHKCHDPITETEFSLSGKDAYHKLCFKELTHPKCEVCHHFIPTNEDGLIEYRCHPFWSQKYCPSHEYDRTVRCCSCERLEPCNTKYVSLGDGRNLCLECLESAIMDTGACQPLYRAIKNFYEGMNMKIDQEIPMLLVQRQVLNEAREGEKHGIHRTPETRGLCLSEEQTVTSVQRPPRMERRGLVGIKTQPQKLIRRCEVTAILVLYGLPRLLTGAILTHELMHAWLRLNDYRDLSPEVEEGICQVLAHMWLESEVMPSMRNAASSSSSSMLTSRSKPGPKSVMENKLGEFFLHQIANDSSPAYGGGYRAAMAAVNRYGLRRTLDHIQHTTNLPA